MHPEHTAVWGVYVMLGFFSAEATLYKLHSLYKKPIYEYTDIRKVEKGGRTCFSVP